MAKSGGIWQHCETVPPSLSSEAADFGLRGDCGYDIDGEMFGIVEGCGMGHVKGRYDSSGLVEVESVLPCADGAEHEDFL